MLTLSGRGEQLEDIRQSVPARVAPLAAAALRSFGRATSHWRSRPAFLIVGGQRCGTTSMFRTLVQHPLIHGPVLRKGVHYFDANYLRGPSWYFGHFPLRRVLDTRTRRVDGSPLVGESSPYYMFHPWAAQRIAADLPTVRLLVMLRDPVERAYSAHAHELARGFETQPFEKALELEGQRLAGELGRMLDDPTYQSSTLRHNAYRTRGQYIDQLEPLTKLFGRERMHVVDSHDFFEDPTVVFGGVLAFLGMPPVDGIRFERHNVRPRAPMSEAVRDELERHFQPFDNQLSAWLGTPPSWRR